MTHPRFRAPRYLAALCFPFVTLCAHAGVTESLVYTRYPADASAAKSLLGALNAASPIRENGQIFHAYRGSSQKTENKAR